MQQALQDLSDLLEGFVERDQDGVLVLECDDVQVLYAAKQLAGLDERDEADVFEVFCEPVGASVHAWLDALVRHLETQLAGLDERCEATGATSWPRLPAAVRTGEPLARVQAMLGWLLARLPAGDHRLVWAFLPVEIHDHDGYGALGAALLRDPLAPRVRLVLRDDVAAPRFAPAAHQSRGTRILAHRVTLDPGSLVDAVADLARNPQHAPRDRMLAVLQLAFLDLGHGRTAAARHKFTATANYFARSGDPALQSVAMGGSADATARAGEPDRARAEYDAALLVAARAGALPVVLNHALTLGALCRNRRQLADAEAYYLLAAQTAEKTVNPFARADALAQVGELQLAQRRPADAAATWTTATEICRETGYVARLATVLAALRDVHAAAGRATAARACEDERAALQVHGATHP